MPSEDALLNCCAYAQWLCWFLRWALTRAHLPGIPILCWFWTCRKKHQALKHCLRCYCSSCETKSVASELGWWEAVRCFPERECSAHLQDKGGSYGLILFFGRRAGKIGSRCARRSEVEEGCFIGSRWSSVDSSDQSTFLYSFRLAIITTFTSLAAVSKVAHKNSDEDGSIF